MKKRKACLRFFFLSFSLFLFPLEMIKICSGLYLSQICWAEREINSSVIKTCFSYLHPHFFQFFLFFSVTLFSFKFPFFRWQHPLIHFLALEIFHYRFYEVLDSVTACLKSDAEQLFCEYRRKICFCNRSLLNISS